MATENQIQEWVRAAQNGDEAAFGQVYEALSQRLFNFLLARTRHHQLSEDLLHTVFLKAWNSLNSYVPGRAKFSTWMFQIANFTLIDHWRAKKDSVDLDAVENMSAFATEPAKFEKYDYLLRAMKELPEDQQTVLNLRFWQDLEYSEVALVMKKTQVAIRVLQHRAAKNLAKKIKDLGLN